MIKTKISFYLQNKTLRYTTVNKQYEGEIKSKLLREDIRRRNYLNRLNDNRIKTVKDTA